MGHRLGYLWLLLPWAAEAQTDSGLTETNLGISGDLIGVFLLVFLPALLLTLVGSAVVRWWRRNRAERTPESDDGAWISTIPESEEAIDPSEHPVMVELRNLRALYHAGRYRDFVDAIALLVKRYISERYQVKVADTTTAQILAHLPQSLSDGIVDYVGEILNMCDALTFSNHRPSRGELDRLYQSTLEFFERYGPAAPSAEPAEPERLPSEDPPEDEDEGPADFWHWPR